MKAPPAGEIGPANRARPAPPCGTAFGCPRDFQNHRYVYTVISPRAHGLSVGVNLNPDQHCNFDCIYCEVDRSAPGPTARLEVPAMVQELDELLAQVHSGEIRHRPGYQTAPPELLKLRHVALSGDGEPTLCPNFTPAVEAVIHLRSRGRFPFFKLVLITNASRIDRPEVIQGLALFTPRDEIWMKLEAGTQNYMDRVNQADCTLDSVLSKILTVARQRPVVIQSLFLTLAGQVPPASEITAYVARLRELREDGAKISLVQIHSAARPTVRSDCGHLSLKALSQIARQVRDEAGLPTEVF